MRLFVVRDLEQDLDLWVAALSGEHMYCYVQNTGRFHDNNSLRNDYYMERELRYTSVNVANARQLITEGIGLADEDRMSEPLARWRADTNALEPEAVFTAVTASMR